MKVDWVPISQVTQLVRVPIRFESTAVYQQVGVRGFGRGLFSYEPVSGDRLGQMRYFTLEPNRLVVSNIKAWEGAVGVTASDEVGHIISNRFLTYRSTEANLAYLRHWLLSEPGLRLMGQASPGSADRNRTLSTKRFERIVVPLPKRSDQDRITTHLSALTPRARPESDYRLRLAHYEWQGEEWAVADLVERVTRRDEPTAGNVYPMQGVRWYGEGLFTREVRAGSDLKSPPYRIEPGDLVYNRLFAWKQSFALATKRGWASNEFPSFRVRTDRVRPRVLLAALLGSRFTASVNAASTGSTPTSRNRLKEREFLALSVTVPQPSDQAAVEASLNLIDQTKPLRQRREALSAAILPAARNEIFNAMR